MGRLKEHYHDEITRGLGKDSFLDDDFLCKRWEEERNRKEAEALLLPEDENERNQAELEAFENERLYDEEWLSSREEEIKFFQTYEVTGTYPM